MNDLHEGIPEKFDADPGAVRFVPEETAPFNPAPLFAALAKARGEFPEIPKNRTATVRSQKGTFSYKYADLSDVFNAIDDVLAAHGLFVSQWPEGDMIMTMLGHESGAQRTTPYPLHTDESDRMHPAQEFSKTITMAKRYALCAALGIATEESIEGDHSSRRPTSKEDIGLDANFETGDGTRMPRGCKFPTNATPRQKAEAAAEAIIGQFNDAKTTRGVNGAWNRNQMFIDLLDQKHNDLFQTVFDAFHGRLEGLQDDEKGSDE